LHYIVFDLEATCWDGAPPNNIREIIEIGALKLNRYGEVKDTFSRFIRPKVNFPLSPYCMTLTGIKQLEVGSAPFFPEVIESFFHWANIWEEEYSLISWGAKDLELLLNDCALHHIETDWIDPHVNLKKQYKDLKALPKPVGLLNALKREGYDFEGRHHRGLDDAANLAKIFVKYIDEWAI
jgi:3'-5' exoribonuclease 1